MPAAGRTSAVTPALLALCVLRCQAGRVSAPSSACHHVGAGAERGAHGGALGAAPVTARAPSARARAVVGGGDAGAARRGGNPGTRGRGGGGAGAPLLRATHATPHGRAAGRSGSSPSSGAASRGASLATQAVEPRVGGARRWRWSLRRAGSARAAWTRWRRRSAGRGGLV